MTGCDQPVSLVIDGDQLVSLVSVLCPNEVSRGLGACPPPGKLGVNMHNFGGILL